ncbi:hypothetical protein F4808DRAFT_282423 [Astrocystis sublimbata]|nr:hypothetical protein F4808DRAFT_282423 [Astrocystis sublimbata]
MTDQDSGSSLPQARDVDDHLHDHPHDHQAQHRQPAHPHFRNGNGQSLPHGQTRNRNHQRLHHIRSQRDSSSRPQQRDNSSSSRPQQRSSTPPENADSDSDVVVVVETISVYQVTDLTGSVVVKTLPHEHPTTTTTADTPAVTADQSESTIPSSTQQPSPSPSPSSSPTGLDLPETGVPDTNSISPSTSSATDDGNGVAHPTSSSSPSIEDPTVTPSGTSMPTSFPTFSYASIPATPLSAPPAFPSLGGPSNSTYSSLNSSSSSLLTSSTASSTSANSTASLSTTTSDEGVTVLGGPGGTRSKTLTESQSSSSVLTSQSASGTSTSMSDASSNVAYTYYTNTATHGATTTSGADGIGSPAGTVDSDGSASTTGPDPGSGPNSGSTSTATIAGSVVGAISGLALILLLAATFLRWRRRNPNMKLLQGSGNDRGYGATASGGNGGPTNGGGGALGGMSEQRRSIPFAIPAALANLTSQNRASRGTVASDGAERGFTKVSGRKLPPVLQFGGDGYTDPRATMMSDQSIDYRASQLFFGEAPLSRLAVGSPMLQETSIPVFHASPARTAVPTRSPFTDDPFSDDNRAESPVLPPDLIGRSHLSQDRSTRSHGSFSRFTEDL